MRSDRFPAIGTGSLVIICSALWSAINATTQPNMPVIVASSFDHLSGKFYRFETYFSIPENAQGDTAEGCRNDLQNRGGGLLVELVALSGRRKRGQFP